MSVPDLTPVPLDEIERLAGEATEGPWFANDNEIQLACVETDDFTGIAYDIIVPSDARHIAAADPPTVRAPCEALRIAVEGLDVVNNHAIGKCDPSCYDHMTDAASAALAAVRELVDLGGDDA